MTTTELLRADALIDLGRYDEAVVLLRRLLADEAQATAGAWCRLSLAYFRLDRDQEALDAAAQAATLDPTNDWPHRLASHALESLGRPQEAVAAAATAVQLAPDVWQTHARFAAALSGAGGDLALARQAAIHAVQLAPDEPDAHSAVGLVALRQGDDDTAEQAFRQVLALQPGHHSALNNLAVVQLRRRNVDAALTGFSEAIRNDPQMEVARRNVDVVVRAVVNRAQLFVISAAWLTFVAVNRSDANGNTETTSRGARIALVSAFAAMAALGIAWTLRRVPKALRPYARSLVRRRRRMSVAVSITALAFLALFLVPVPDDASTSVLAALASALLGLAGALLSSSRLRLRALAHRLPKLRRR